MRYLETSYNPDAQKVIEEAIKKPNDSVARRDIICLAMQSISTFNEEDEHQTFRDAWDHPD